MGWDHGVDSAAVHLQRGAPVPDVFNGREAPHTQRFRSSLQRMRKVKDRLADGAVNCEPVSLVKFPDHRGKYREFPVLRLRNVLIVAKKQIFAGHLASNSLLKLNRELISVEQGVDSGIREKIARSAIIGRQVAGSCFTTIAARLILSLDYDFGTLRARSLAAMAASRLRWLRTPFFWLSLLKTRKASKSLAIYLPRP